MNRRDLAEGTDGRASPKGGPSQTIWVASEEPTGRLWGGAWLKGVYVTGDLLHVEREAVSLRLSHERSRMIVRMQTMCMPI